MHDWFRSVALLALAFTAVVVVTLGMADVIVPAAGAGLPGATAGGGPVPAASNPGATPSPTHRLGTIGGSLEISGDREGTFVLDAEVTQDRYGLRGPEGRIAFEGGEEVRVANVQYDGLEFFVDPGECTVSPGERHDPTGTVPVRIRCDGISDVRDNGTITMDGAVGMAASLFGLRGGLPESGGTVEIGGERLTIDGLFLSTDPFGFIGAIIDPDASAVITVAYDPQTHGFSIGNIQLDDDVSEVPQSACSITERMLGVLDPHTRVSELLIECSPFEVVPLGTVPIRGELVAEITDPPR